MTNDKLTSTNKYKMFYTLLELTDKFFFITIERLKKVKWSI